MRVEPSRRRDYRGQGRPTDRPARVEEPACKPDSVPRSPANRRAGWRPSLWEPRRRDPRAAYPGASGGPPAPCSALLRVGFAQPTSHPAAGELLPHRFTLAPVRTVGTEHSPTGGRSVSVALSAGHPAWALPSTLPCGVRTFLGKSTAAAARPTPPPSSIGGEPAPALVEQFGAGLGPDIVPAVPGQPLIDSVIGQPICLAVLLPRDVLEVDLSEPRQGLADLPVQSDQRRILHPEPAGELFDKEPAVGSDEDVRSAELGTRLQACQDGPVLGDVVRGHPNAPAHGCQHATTLIRDQDADSGGTRVPPGGPVAVGDQVKIRILRQYSHLRMPRSRFIRSTYIGE